MVEMIKISMTIPEDVNEKFKEHCKRFGFKISTRMAKLMEFDVQQWNKFGDMALEKDIMISGDEPEEEVLE